METWRNMVHGSLVSLEEVLIIWDNQIYQAGLPVAWGRQAKTVGIDIKEKKIEGKVLASQEAFQHAKS